MIRILITGIKELQVNHERIRDIFAYNENKHPPKTSGTPIRTDTSFWTLKYYHYAQIANKVQNLITQDPNKCGNFFFLQIKQINKSLKNTKPFII